VVCGDRVAVRVRRRVGGNDVFHSGRIRPS
jgi:hypothetical protein